jgi:transposase
LLLTIIHAANIQDRDGGILLMATLLKERPLLQILYAGADYQGPNFRHALRRILRKINVKIVKRSDATKGFAVLPKRWVVERSIGWFNHCRRLAKDWERLNKNARAFVRWASIRIMLKRLCKIT